MLWNKRGGCIMLSNWGLRGHSHWCFWTQTYSVSSNDVLWTNIVRVIKCGWLIDLVRNSTVLCHIKASSGKREFHSIWCDFTCFPWTLKKKFTRKRVLTSWNIMCLLYPFRSDKVSNRWHNQRQDSATSSCDTLSSWY